MSYIIIKVYSFECDALDCTEILDVTPAPSKGALIEAARREMASEWGWSCEPDADYCPKHKV